MKKNNIIRVIAAIAIIIIAGVVSYYGSKVFFLHKFQKDQEKAEKEAQEELAESVNENYTTVIRVGKANVIRILNTENNILSYALINPEDDLVTYEDGSSSEDIESVVSKIQDAYGIQVDSYEDFNQESFVELINQSDSFECDLPNAMSFTDINHMEVQLEAGSHILNGIQAWGIVSGDGEYGSTDAYMENVKAFIEAYSTCVLDEASVESITAYADILFKTCESNKTTEDVKAYFSYYANVKETNVLSLSEDDEAKQMLEDIMAGKSVEEVTEEKTEEETEAVAEEISSKDATIYIRNAAYINGLAGKWTNELQNKGYNIGSVDNYDETYDQTIIRVAKEGMGEDLKAEYFPNATIEVGNVEDDADICIYLGKDADTLD